MRLKEESEEEVMTREEAIRRMEFCRNFLANNYSDMGEPNITAFNMAIKALEQEPCEDAISRQAVSYIIKSHIHEIITESGTDKNAHTNAVLRSIVNLVETMPSVTPTRKKGKWERGYSFPDGEYVKCTVCGEIIKCIYPMHYCPNCGAEMESEE